MYKQSPVRNHRSKGFKVKHVLQICLLLAVCFWLIYQVKHSHDKKKEFDETDLKFPIKTENSNVKLGRKDVRPRIEGVDRVNDKHILEPEDETLEEEEGNKQEEDLEEDNNTKEKIDEHTEDVQSRIEGVDTVNDKHREEPEDETVEEEGNKQEEDLEEENNAKEKIDEHTEDEKDEVDDHDQEKSDAEVDHEEDIVDEDKERGEGDEKDTEERDSEVNDNQVEEENLLEDHNHDEDSSSHEAREENYKGDDASSAVTHDTAVTTTENESGKSEQEAEHTAEAKSEVGVNNSMQTNAGENTTDLKVEDGKTDVEGSPLNTTNSEKKDGDHASVSNSIRTEGLIDNSESRTHSTEASTQTHDISLLNGTQAVTQENNVMVEDTTSEHSDLSISSSQQNSISADIADNNQIDSNLTFSSKNDGADSTPVDSSNVSGDTESSLAENVIQGNATVEAVGNVELPLKDGNETEAGKADTSDETGTTDEGVDASISENLGEAQDDPIDTSDSSTHLEEKHIRTDLETLPEIQTEGSRSEDDAAE